MITGLRHLHSGLAYLVLAGLIISVIIFFIKRGGHKSFTKSDKLLALITLIFTHLQLVIGLVLYLFGPKGLTFFGSEGVMQDATLRFYAVEHIGVNLIGVILITMGYSKAKRAATDKKRFGNLSVFYLLGLVLILSRIPWDAWLS